MTYVTYGCKIVVPELCAVFLEYPVYFYEIKLLEQTKIQNRLAYEHKKDGKFPNLTLLTGSFAV